MKANNVEVKKDDYERYKIPISLMTLLPKAQKKYICGELEKRHPCFSEDCYYFSRDVFSRKGVFADVVVMQKSKLGKYKNQSGKGYISINGRKLPKNEKLTKNKLLILIIFCLIFIFSFCHVFYKTCNNKKKLKVETVQPIENQYSKKFSEWDKDLLNKIFLITKENKGNIQKLNWKLTLAGEYISGTINNLYPELLEENVNGVEIKSTKYFDKKPFFDYSLINKFVLTNKENNLKKITPNVKEIIRKALAKNNINLVEEVNYPYEIIFNFNSLNKKETENFLAEISSELDKVNVYITGINIYKLQNKEKLNMVRVELVFSNLAVYENKTLKHLSQNIDLFFDISEKYLENNNYKKEIVEITPVNNIIGEVLYKSGKKIIFYKTAAGKIEKKEIYQNEKS